MTRLAVDIMQMRRSRIVHLVLVIGFCTLWRLPSLLEPPWVNDEGTYATVGHLLRTQPRALLYRDVWENKPPAIYLLFGAADALASPTHLLLTVRLAALLAALALPLLVYLLMATTLAQDHGRALYAALLADILIDLPVLEGTTANAETFMTPLALSGLVLVWPRVVTPSPRSPSSDPPEHNQEIMSSFVPREHRWRLWTGGMCLGFAVLFKAVALADAMAAMLLVAGAPVMSNYRRGLKEWARERWRPLALVCAGIVTPLLVTTMVFAVQGPAALAAFAWATVGYNIGYVNSGVLGPGSVAGTAALHVVVSGLILGLLIVSTMLFIRSCRVVRLRTAAGNSIPTWQRAGLILWAAYALIGALSGGRPHVHYFLEAVAPLACLACAIFPSRRKPWRARRCGTTSAAITAVILLVTMASARHGPRSVAQSHNLLAYYAGFWWLSTGQQTTRDFAADLDSRVIRTLDLATYLEHDTGATPQCPRTLLVWGNAPWIYYLSRLRPVTRFTSTDYQPPIPGAAQEIVDTVRHVRSGIVVILDEARQRSRVTLALSAGYRRATTLDGSAIVMSPACMSRGRS